MTRVAQTGTLALVLALAAQVAGCETEDSKLTPHADASVSSGDAGASARDAAVVTDAAVVRDAASHTSSDAAVGACDKHSDCALVAHGCCAACSPTKADYLAVPASQVAAATHSQCPAGPVSCSPCPPQPDQPLAPRLHAACVAQHCEVVDLRENDLSLCSSDADCALDSASCCPACGDSPSAFVSLRVAADRSLLACFPIPPCDPCTAGDNAPQAFCAADGHCAVRRSEKVGEPKP